MDSFLMIGQSNMAGRGELDDVPPIENERCFMLRCGRWQPMRDPVNPDRPIFGPWHSGVSLAPSFADAYANASGRDTGLIPCADGGTKLCQWMPGEILFDHAVMMTKLALRTSELRGILWHQGESDCVRAEDAETYGERLIGTFAALRAELGLGDVPILLGELYEGIGPSWGTEGREREFNRALPGIVAKIPNAALVSAKGLTLKPDGIHFDSVSQREFGRRYYAAYAELTK